MQVSLSEKNSGEEPPPAVYQHLAKKIDPRSGAPLYQQIFSLMEEFIEEGRLPPGERLPPERQLMRWLGVSRSTLRAALGTLVERRYVSATQGRGNFILEPPRKRELRLLALEKFRANHWSVSPVHYDWINEAGKAALAQINYHYIPILEDLLRTLAIPPSGCEGMLIFRSLPEWSEALNGMPEEAFEKCPVPVMVIGRPIHKKGLNVVTYDYFEAARRATEKLLALGHSRVGFIGGRPVAGHSFMDFHEGYTAAIQAANLPYTPEDILFVEGELIVGGISPEHVTTQMADFLKRRNYTAVVVTLLTLPFEKAVQKSGIVLPDDLSVMAVTEEHALTGGAIRWSAMSEPSAQIVTRGVEVLAEICRGIRKPGVYEVVPPEEREGGTRQILPG